MEKAFLQTKGTLARRMFAAMMAGDNAGGDSRGRQSAVLIVVQDKAGYGGFNDRKIDIRVDDHTDPFTELGRLLELAEMNAAWNIGWTLFTEKKYPAALIQMEQVIDKGAKNAEFMYDLAVIRLAVNKKPEALQALAQAISLNPKLKKQARSDNDLIKFKGDAEFEKLLKD
jgi:tetratricopeptide (TPR) repeat protein